MKKTSEIAFFPSLFLLPSIHLFFSHHLPCVVFSRNLRADKDFLKYLEENLQKLQAEHKKWVVKDEIERVYSENGAVGFNAFTSQDCTPYVVSLPSNRLELWARIESDRLLSPVLREFYSERDVVMEERRRSYESKPQRKLMEHDFWSLMNAPGQEIPRPEKRHFPSGATLAGVCECGDLLDEDLYNLPRIQRGMNSAAFEALHLGTQEVRILHHHDVLMRYIEGRNG